MRRPEEIRQLGLRKYPDFLRAVAAGEPFFPLEIRFGKPTASDPGLFDLRADLAALRDADARFGFRVEWEEINSRRWGRQRVPARVWFDNETDYLRALDKEEEAALFRRNLVLTRERCPALESWLRANTGRVVDHGKAWPELLAVCVYFLEHPRPNLYARQLPLPIHTKFIEQHRDILRALLDALIPSFADPGADTFEGRFHLREDEPAVRLRFLDPGVRERAGFPVDDVTLPLSSVAGLRAGLPRCLVVENKMVFLTLPPLPNTLAFWGSGKAAALLGAVGWLEECNLYYWGDMDDSGYRILSHFRGCFPRVQSLLMDWGTWKRFQEWTGPGKVELAVPPAGLDESELRAWGAGQAENLRLEQEQIPQEHVEAVLRSVFGEGENCGDNLGKPSP